MRASGVCAKITRFSALLLNEALTNQWLVVNDFGVISDLPPKVTNESALS